MALVDLTTKQNYLKYSNKLDTYVPDGGPTLACHDGTTGTGEKDIAMKLKFGDIILDKPVWLR